MSRAKDISPRCNEGCLYQHLSLKQKCHFDGIFIGGCTEICQNRYIFFAFLILNIFINTYHVNAYVTSTPHKNTSRCGILVACIHSVSQKVLKGIRLIPDVQCLMSLPYTVTRGILGWIASYFENFTMYRKTQERFWGSHISKPFPKTKTKIRRLV